MDLENEVRLHLLVNATRHGGKAAPKAVLGAVLGGHPELRSDPKAVMKLAGRIAVEINAMTPEQQAAALDDLGYEEPARETKGLPPLLDASGAEWSGGVVMRFAPGPSGPLHLGHTRALVLNDEYVRRYGGRMVLRIEDTNPTNILPEAYDMIREDADWLGIGVSEVVVQSDRLDIHYDHARRLLGMGAAYVCTCPPDDWRDMKKRSIACPHRDADGVEDWERMLDGTFGVQEASLVVKTDLEHKNPAVRDFVAMRVVDVPHPRTGDRYRVYPTYNFAVAVDDHLMGMTHILRGKDHLNNTIRQQYVYSYFGWTEPVFIHYGWVKIEGAVLKTSVIKEAIAAGAYSGWDDIRLGTLKALEARGIRPEAIREIWKEVGTNEVDIVFSWENLFSQNKKAVDDDAMRLFFTADPVRLEIATDGPLTLKAPVQPNHPDRGYREYGIEPTGGVVKVFLPGGEVPADGKLRLKDLCNVELEPASGDVRKGAYIGNDISILKEGAPLLQAVPERIALPCEVWMPDGEVLEGFIENGVQRLEPMTVVQLERFGFVNVVEIGERVVCNFAHK